MSKYGLVLSGGGAKGAYQVGIIKALAEMDIQIEAVAGASIGALNGAIIACADNTLDASKRLQSIWQTLGDEKIFQFGSSTSATIQRLAPQIILGLAAGLKIHPTGRFISIILSQFINSSPAIFEDSPLKKIMLKYLDMDKLNLSGLPFYVSVFENDHYLLSGLSVLMAELFGHENKLSTFEHIQELPVDKQKEYILASAALPLIFEAKDGVNKQRLTDGGQGGWISSQGNTPIAPLIKNGCRKIIVSHLSKGSLWDRHDFDAEIYEIRPTIDFGFGSVLKFDQEYIDSLIEAGYRDTTEQLGKVFTSLDSVSKLRKAPRITISDYDVLDKSLDNYLEKLNSIKKI